MTHQFAPTMSGYVDAVMGQDIGGPKGLEYRWIKHRGRKNCLAKLATITQARRISLRQVLTELAREAYAVGVNTTGGQQHDGIPGVQLGRPG